MNSYSMNMLYHMSSIQDLASNVRIRSFSEGAFLERDAEIVQEREIHVVLNGKNYGDITCSPWNTMECIIGLLYAQSEVTCRADIQEYHFDEQKCVAYVKTGHGFTEEASRQSNHFSTELESLHGGISTGTYRGFSENLKPQEINALIATLENDCCLFHRTGGVHSAALATRERMLCREEDVSRQAALDKLIGHCLLYGVRTQGNILLFSGRMPQSIVARAVKMGCSTIISPGAPTDLSIDCAQRNNVTLIGFAKQGRFNVYTCKEGTLSIKGMRRAK